MMKQILICMFLSVLLLAEPVQAGVAEITWSQSDEYTDMVPSQETKQALEKRVVNSLDRYWQNLADKLPSDYRLHVTITDIDLAGKVIGGKKRQLDVFDFPQLSLSYSLQDNKGTIIPLTDTHIKSDLSYLHDIPRQLKNDSFSAEKALMKEWFDETFKPYLTSK